MCRSFSRHCASVGPEAAVGAIGASLGTHLSSFRFISKPYIKIFFAIFRIAAAFGPLLPSPVLSSMLLHELTIASESMTVLTLCIQLKYPDCCYHILRYSFQDYFSIKKSSVAFFHPSSTKARSDVNL